MLLSEPPLRVQNWKVSAHKWWCSPGDGNPELSSINVTWLILLDFSLLRLEFGEGEGEDQLTLLSNNPEFGEGGGEDQLTLLSNNQEFGEGGGEDQLTLLSNNPDFVEGNKY